LKNEKRTTERRKKEAREGEVKDTHRKEEEEKKRRSGASGWPELEAPRRWQQQGQRQQGRSGREQFPDISW